MNMPSGIAAVTLGFRDLIKTAMPPKVEVSTLPPAKGQKFVRRAGLLARVNVALYRISTHAVGRNTPPSRRGSSAADEPQRPALDLRYLVTAYGTASPAQEHSTERLIEAAYGAIHRQPILTSADLASALPSAAGTRPNISARITEEELPLADLALLFSAMRAEYRPTSAYVVALSET